MTPPAASLPAAPVPRCSCAPESVPEGNLQVGGSVPEGSPASSPFPYASRRSIPLEIFQKVVSLEIQLEFLGVLLSFSRILIIFFKGGREADKEGIAW